MGDVQIRIEGQMIVLCTIQISLIHTCLKAILLNLLVIIKFHIKLFQILVNYFYIIIRIVASKEHMTIFQSLKLFSFLYLSICFIQHSFFGFIIIQ